MRCKPRIAVVLAAIALAPGLSVAAADGVPVPVASPATGAQTKPGPRSSYENPEVDLGDVVRGTSAQAVFRIRNVGTEPLKIVGVRPG